MPGNQVRTSNGAQLRFASVASERCVAVAVRPQKCPRRRIYAPLFGMPLVAGHAGMEASMAKTNWNRINSEARDRVARAKAPLGFVNAAPIYSARLYPIRRSPRVPAYRSAVPLSATRAESSTTSPLYRYIDQQFTITRERALSRRR